MKADGVESRAAVYSPGPGFLASLHEAPTQPSETRGLEPEGADAGTGGTDVRPRGTDVRRPVTYSCGDKRHVSVATCVGDSGAEGGGGSAHEPAIMNVAHWLACSADTKSGMPVPRPPHCSEWL